MDESARVKELGGLDGRLTIFNSSPSASVRITLYQMLAASNRGAGADCAFDTMNVVIVVLCAIHDTNTRAHELIRRTVLPCVANQHSITR